MWEICYLFTKLTNIHAFNISWFLKFKAIGVLFPLDYGDAQAQSARHLGKFPFKIHLRKFKISTYEISRGFTEISLITPTCLISQKNFNSIL